MAEMAEEEQWACFKRICGRAEQNKQQVPNNFFVEGDKMFCAVDDRNPEMPVARRGKNGEWVAFFET